MGEASKLMRSSIIAFLQSYHSFASIATLLVLPVSASLVLSQAFAPSSHTVGTISSRLHPLFEAARFPTASRFFALLNIKISQTVFSFILTLPFTLSFLILAKAAVVRTVCRHSSHSSWQLYRSILSTHLFNSFIVFSANAAIFALLFIVFNVVDIVGLSSSSFILAFSAASGILYSVVLASTTVTCNLAIVVSAVYNCGGYLPLLEACVLVGGRLATALALALPTNVGMAAMEMLFRYRVMKPYNLSKRFSESIVWEGFTIAYLYSFLMVLDMIMTCMFFKSCKLDCGCDCRTELEPQDKGVLQV